MSGPILIIDAEEAFTQQLTDVFQSTGLDATVTADGKAGLDLAHINIPSAIILCVELPGVSGYTICNKLKKDDILRSVPVVLTSSEATEQTFANHRKLRTRADEYLKKPFPPALLLELLGAHLQIEAATSSQDVEIDDDIPVDLSPPETLSDDEAFSAEEAASMEANDDPSHRTDMEVAPDFEPVQDDDSPFANALAASVGSATPQVDEYSEALTTVGMLEDHDGGTAQLQAELMHLRAEVDSLRQAKESAERARDEAFANQRAAEAQAEAMSQRPSIPPPSGGGREALELKKERNALEKELVQVREDLNAKERQLVAWRDKETELESRIVELEEGYEASERAKTTAEAVAAGARAKADELQRTLEAQLDDLKHRLGESTAHEAELEAAVASLRGELEQTRGALAEEEHRAKELSGQVDVSKRQLAALQGRLEEQEQEVDRLSNELSAAGAESDSLRETIRERDGELATQQARGDELEGMLSHAQNQIRQLQTVVHDLSIENDAASQNLSRAEEVRNKALKALDIAQALLGEAGYDSGEGASVESSDALEDVTGDIEVDVDSGFGGAQA